MRVIRRVTTIAIPIIIEILVIVKIVLVLMIIITIVFIVRMIIIRSFVGEARGWKFQIIFGRLGGRFFLLSSVQ